MIKFCRMDGGRMSEAGSCGALYCSPLVYITELSDDDILRISREKTDFSPIEGEWI